MKLFSNFVPTYLRVLFNQIKNKAKFDIKFGKGATAYNTYFEGKNLINNNTCINNSFVGFATYVAGNSNLKNVKIGRYCSIGQNVKTGFGIHPLNFISTHPCFYSLQKQAGFTYVAKQLFDEHKYTDSTQKYYVEIGNDVWIGNDVRIMDGVKIGDGSVIAMGAIVTKDVDPYSIVGGIPAKLIRKRFNEKKIANLLELSWWNFDEQTLKMKSYLYTDIHALNMKP